MSIWQGKGSFRELKMQEFCLQVKEQFKISAWILFPNLISQAVLSVHLSLLQQCSATQSGILFFPSPYCSISWIPFLNAAPSYFLQTPSSFSATLPSTLSKFFWFFFLYLLWEWKNISLLWTAPEGSASLAARSLHVQAGQLAGRHLLKSQLKLFTF